MGKASPAYEAFKSQNLEGNPEGFFLNIDLPFTRDNCKATLDLPKKTPISEIKHLPFFSGRWRFLLLSLLSTTPPLSLASLGSRAPWRRREQPSHQPDQWVSALWYVYPTTNHKLRFHPKWMESQLEHVVVHAAYIHGFFCTFWAPICNAQLVLIKLNFCIGDQSELFIKSALSVG